MSSLVLTGLIGSHPLGAMAAFGLLRVLSTEDRATRLSFVEQDDWIAVLDCRFASVDELLKFLAQWSNAVPKALEVFGKDDVRVPTPSFRGLLRAALSAGSENLALASFLGALAADGAEDQSKHLIKPSPFYMASGQQSFIDTMRRIHAGSRTQDAWSEALLGPWSYATEEWGAGWDPGSERLHALRGQAPSKDKTTCVVGAVRLAFEALPLFPTFSVARVVHTVGWLRAERLERFRWPVPSTPTSVETLAVLLASSEVLRKKWPMSRRRAIPWRREGVGAIYESVRHEFGQGYAVFRPSRRIA